MNIQEAIEHSRDVAKCKRAEATYNFPALAEYYNECKKCADEHEQLAEWLEELKGYKQLGTLEEVREAVEKQKKKKPIEDRHHGIRYTEVYRCHSCNGSFSGRGFAKYCFHCGQAIDWSEKE